MVVYIVMNRHRLSCPAGYESRVPYPLLPARAPNLDTRNEIFFEECVKRTPNPSARSNQTATFGGSFFVGSGLRSDLLLRPAPRGAEVAG